MRLLMPAFFILLIANGCNKKKEAINPLFIQLPEQKTGIHFSNDLQPYFEYDYFYNGGGVAAADFNNDGLTDLYFTGNQVSSSLYINNGSFTFQDITKEAAVETKNWATGVAVADINNDGWKDIYVCFSGAKTGPERTHKLFINQGTNQDSVPVFKESAVDYGLADTSYSSNALFVDYDRDGDLDLYLVTHDRSNTNPNFPSVKKNDGTANSTDKLFRNDLKNGKPYFTDISFEAGIKHEGYSLSASIADLNNDGWPDIYVCNDFVYDDLLYINNRDGTFTESIHDIVKHTSRFSMGSDIADFNNDGRPDIITMDMLPDENERQKLMSTGINNDLFNLSLYNSYLPQYSRNMLQLNNGLDHQGKPSFSEIGQLAGIYKTDWSWSALFVDLDNDGWKDLFITNGIPKDITNNDFIAYREQAVQATQDYADIKKNVFAEADKLPPVEKTNFLFSNNGDLTFSDKNEAWGFYSKGFSNGAVYADLDNDGDLDLVTNNINRPASVFQNQSELFNPNNYLRIKLNGRYATNAKIILYQNENKQFAENSTARGFQSSQEEVVHFGIGKNKIVDSIKVTWLNGKYQMLRQLPANQVISLSYTDSATLFETKKDEQAIMPSLFTNVTATTGISFNHIENEIEDFDFEPLLPHRFSKTGPFIAVADVDKNGYEDFWIGGPAHISGTLFLQQANGKFISKEMPDKGYEDMGGVFFDADADKDMDLYVVSGGNEYKVNTVAYQDRLYLNDGKGNFVNKTGAVPLETTSGSCVVPCDFDKDGDIDLFVGGRVKPGSYPYPVESFILKNNGVGKFENVTQSVCPELLLPGLVTTALWSDFDNDGWQDLIVTGEWMPVSFYHNNQGKLEKIKVGNEVDSATGWWCSIAGGDFDKDGDQDYVVGNLGRNNKYQPNTKQPLSVYAKDYDGNGATESLLSYYLNGTEYPVSGRDQVASLLPSIKRKFDTYSKFASQSFHGVFSGSELKDALKLKVTTFSSSYFENKGNGIFSIHPLPIQAQFSTIQSFYISDFNNDTNLDILVGGNFYSPDYMTGRYDASIGLVLKGDGKGNFQPVEQTLSGIHFKGDVRDMKEISIGNKKAVIVASNTGKLEMYGLRLKLVNKMERNIE